MINTGHKIFVTRPVASGTVTQQFSAGSVAAGQYHVIREQTCDIYQHQQQLLFIEQKYKCYDC